MTTLDSRHGYGTLSIVNHWVSAVAVIAVLGLGLVFHELPRGGERAALEAWHISLGMIALPVFVARIAWRFGQGYPDPVPGPRWQQVAAKLVSLLLMGSIVVLGITGPLSIWAKGENIALFNWFTIAPPFSLGAGPADILEEVHESASDVLLFSLLIHIAAALKHAFVNRDNTLRRMLRSTA